MGKHDDDDLSEEELENQDPEDEPYDFEDES